MRQFALVFFFSFDLDDVFSTLQQDTVGTWVKEPYGSRLGTLGVFQTEAVRFRPEHNQALVARGSQWFLYLNPTEYLRCLCLTKTATEKVDRKIV